MSESNDIEHQDLLISLKDLGLTTDDELAQMRSASSEVFQKFIDGLVERKKSLQDDFRQLITIKDVIERHLSRLVSEMLDGRDVTGSLQHATEMYPSLRFISWLVEEGERALT